MKRIIAGCLMLVCIAMVGCMNEMETDFVVTDNGFCVSNRDYTKPLQTYNGSLLDTMYFVSKGEMLDYVDLYACGDVTRSTSVPIKEVVTYGESTGQTLFYIVNFEGGGWMVISSDKRTPAVLSYNDSGSFESETQNENLKYWIDVLSENLLAIRRTSNIANDAQEDNVQQWNGVKNTDKVTRSDSIYIYEIDRESRSRTLGRRDPMLKTKWAQSSENSAIKDFWNKYCPLKSATDTLRTPVGCGAVACAQMLYFLHREKGFSVSMPKGATCRGYVGNYSRSFTMASSDAYIDALPWRYSDTLPMERMRKMQIFMAYVGELLETEYSTGQATVWTNKIVNAFTHYNISCTETFYNEDILYNHVLDGCPVVFYGKDANSNDGHFWVVDGLVHAQTTTINYYYQSNVELTEEELSLLDKDDAHYSEESVATIKYYYMNWGWGGNLDGLYVLHSGEEWMNVGGGYEEPYVDRMRIYHNFNQS